MQLLDYEPHEQEPWWVTLIAVIAFFLIWGFFVLPKELEKKRKEDQAYADRKGISLEQLQQLRQDRRDRAIPNSTRKYVLARDGYKCQYCGSTSSLEIDHIFPFSRGGDHGEDNLQVLCRTCNGSKGASV